MSRYRPQKIVLANGAIALGHTSRIKKSLTDEEISEILSRPIHSERNKKSHADLQNHREADTGHSEEAL